MNADRIGVGAGVATVVCGLVLSAIAFANPGLYLQPSGFPMPVGRFVQATNTAPDLVLVSFAIDMVYVIAYVALFVALHGRTARRRRAFATVGAAGVGLVAVADMIENAFFVTYALQAKAGIPLTDPPAVLLHLITHVKIYGLVVALAFLALALPLDGRLPRVLVALMAVTVPASVLGMVMPSAEPLRVIPQTAVVLCLIVYFRRGAPAREALGEPRVA
ncbi:membrane protein implicated in regulation of membrane protease activity [Thermocatellispora tengchongensis]|uniref:Membrane protein implicated in regulation of membrane protease activity n=1 Tax=Thermocatellispora tengchongensis TaxID=1073253 RepID=A0A840PR58_9ACTN|nr:hypothetical protein [Thermocatellispora tengchongensis]MBB5138455.1 membrane protein implicated in regulation of membrane protease activity [Thermocatellispora tengchongensis]